MNLTFVHVPKNAGTSIKSWLKAHGITTPNRHEIIKPTGFSFGVVRNPWDRHLSMFLHWKYNLNKWKPGTTFEDYVFNLHNLKAIMKNRMHLGLFRTPQANFLENVQHVLRFENLEEDFKVVQKYLNSSVPLKKIPPFNNQTKHGHYSQYYTDGMIKIIEKIARKDISKFNYSYIIQ